MGLNYGWLNRIQLKGDFLLLTIGINGWHLRLFYDNKCTVNVSTPIATIVISFKPLDLLCDLFYAFTDFTSIVV